MFIEHNEANDSIRLSLILSLRNVTLRLSSLLHSKPNIGDNSGNFNSKDSDMGNEFLIAFEKCLFHGLIPGDGILGSESVPLWNYFKSYLFAKDPEMAEIIGNITSSELLASPLARLSAFLRWACNRKKLVYIIRQLINLNDNRKSSSSFDSSSSSILPLYNNNALIFKESQKLIAVLQASLIIPFEFMILDFQLNQPPNWYINEWKLRKLQKQDNKRLSNVPAEVKVNAISLSYANNNNNNTKDVVSTSESIFTTMLQVASIVSKSGRRPKLFGSPLWLLLKTPSRCDESRLDPMLSIPTQIDHLLVFLSDSKAAQTPGLFVIPGPPVETRKLHEYMETERCDILLNSGEISPISAAYVLLQWLIHIPEPLLGYENYEAAVACNAIIGAGDIDEMNTNDNNYEDSIHYFENSKNTESSSSSSSSSLSKDSKKKKKYKGNPNKSDFKEAGKRNLALLLMQVPWYSKSLILRLVPFFSMLLKPENASKNDLDLVNIVAIVSQIFIRDVPASSQSDTNNYGNIAAATALAKGSKAISPIYPIDQVTPLLMKYLLNPSNNSSCNALIQLKTDMDVVRKKATAREVRAGALRYTANRAINLRDIVMKTNAHYNNDSTGNGSASDKDSGDVSSGSVIRKFLNSLGDLVENHSNNSSNSNGNNSNTSSSNSGIYTSKSHIKGESDLISLIGISNVGDDKSSKSIFKPAMRPGGFWACTLLTTFIEERSDVMKLETLESENSKSNSRSNSSDNDSMKGK